MRISGDYVHMGIRQLVLTEELFTDGVNMSDSKVNWLKTALLHFVLKLFRHRLVCFTSLFLSVISLHVRPARD